MIAMMEYMEMSRPSTVKYGNINAFLFGKVDNTPPIGRGIDRKVVYGLQETAIPSSSHLVANC
jgi:hypothetical protein